MKELETPGMLTEALSQGGTVVQTTEQAELTYEDVTEPEVKKAFESSTIGEAGGIAFTSIDVQGYKINITERRNTGLEATIALMETLASLIKDFKVPPKSISSTGTATPFDSKNAPPKSSKHMITITRAKHIQSKKGTHICIVTDSTGAEWLSFESNTPEPFIQWPLNDEYDAPGTMAFAEIDQASWSKGKNWIKFYSQTP